MLIERQLAPALLMVGGAIVFPNVVAVLRELPSPPSATALVTGNLLAGLGLLMGSLTFLDRDRPRLFNLLVLFCLMAIAVLFSASTVMVVLRMEGTGAVLTLLAAAAPLLGTGVGSYGALKGRA